MSQPGASRVEQDVLLNYAANMSKKQNKVDKRKKKKTFLFLENKKLGKKVQPSPIQSALIDMRKKKIKNLNGVINYFQDKNIDKSPEMYEFYNTVLTIKSDVRLMNVKDNITNKRLKYFFVTDVFKAFCFSNDWLYLYSILYQNNINKKNTKIEEEVVKTGNIRSTRVVSNAVSFTDTVRKGFYQDYKEDFFSINTDNPNIDKQKILSGTADNTVTTEFAIPNKPGEYIAYGTLVACVIGLKDETSQFEAFEKKTKSLSNAGKIDLKPKEYKGNISYRYVDSLMRPETFCPAFMVFPITKEALQVRYFFTLVLDYNKLFKFADTKDNKLKQVENIIYWDTLPEAMQFLQILSLTAENLEAKDKEEYGKLYEKYLENKPALDAWAEVQKAAAKYLEMFYRNFSTRINYDKCLKILSKIREYREALKELVEDSSYKDVVLFLKSLGNMAKMIRNQINGNEGNAIQETINKIITVLGSIAKNQNNGLIENLRKIGKDVYELGMQGKALFPFMLTPNGFLGNLFSNKANAQAVEQNLQVQIKKSEDNRRAIQNRNNIMAQVMDNLGTLQKQVITQSVIDHIKKNNINVKPEGIEVIGNEVWNKIANTDYLGLINKKISEVVLDKGIEGLTDVVVDADIIGKVTEKIMLEDKANQFKQQQQISKDDQKTLEMKLSKLNKEIDSNVSKAISNIKQESKSNVQIQIPNIQEEKKEVSSIDTQMTQVKEESKKDDIKEKMKVDEEEVEEEENLEISEDDNNREEYVVYDVNDMFNKVNRNDPRYADVGYYYADLIYLSSKYDNEVSNANELYSMSYDDLISKYPLTNAEADYVIYKYKDIQTPLDVINKGYVQTNLPLPYLSVVDRQEDVENVRKKYS